MGKDLVPRFKCPLCGWLAYYTMLDRGPYKLEIRGMRYDGFQDISYHKIWTGKREYKEYLRTKVRELAKELGIRLADEEEVTDEYDEEEVETESSEVEGVDLEAIGLGTSSSATIGTPSRMVTAPKREVAGEVETEVEELETLGSDIPSSVAIGTPSRMVAGRGGGRLFIEALAKYAYIPTTKEDSHGIITDSQFIERKE